MVELKLGSTEYKWIKIGFYVSIVIYIVFYIVWKNQLTVEEQRDQPKTFKIMEFEIPINGICSYGMGREGTKEWINWAGSIASSICICLLCILLLDRRFGS